jgi:hypothetical protein
MSRVEEIERAIQDLRRVCPNRPACSRTRAGARDAQLDRDASSGELDFLVAEALEDRKQGRLKDWPDPA